jgi:hypothetical protein
MLAQATGKTAALCVPDGSFLASVQSCHACITLHAGRADDTTYEDLVRPRLAQWLDFCDGKAVTGTTSSSGAAQAQTSPTATPSRKPAGSAASGKVGGASSAALVTGVVAGWILLLLMGLA